MTIAKCPKCGAKMFEVLTMCKKCGQKFYHGSCEIKGGEFDGDK